MAVRLVVAVCLTIDFAVNAPERRQSEPDFDYAAEFRT